VISAIQVFYLWSEVLLQLFCSSVLAARAGGRETGCSARASGREMVALASIAGSKMAVRACGLGLEAGGRYMVVRPGAAIDWDRTAAILRYRGRR
jgi:hypothetical protein